MFPSIFPVVLRRRSGRPILVPRLREVYVEMRACIKGPFSVHEEVRYSTFGAETFLLHAMQSCRV